MQNSKLRRISSCKFLCIFITIVIICGCAKNRQAVIAVTGTNIGVEISQNPANQTPQAKLGYQRTEIAIVPTNRSGDVKPDPAGGGAKDVADVLMELKYSNIFSFSGAGIYQRLAVGETAVQQSVLMFARDERGKIDEKTAAAIKNLESMRNTPPDIRKLKATLANFYKSASTDDKKIIEEAVIKAGFSDWNAFLDGDPREPTLEDIDKIKNELKGKGITIP